MSEIDNLRCHLQMSAVPEDWKGYLTEVLASALDTLEVGAKGERRRAEMQLEVATVKRLQAKLLRVQEIVETMPLADATRQQLEAALNEIQ